MANAAYLDAAVPGMASYIAARPASHRVRIRGEIRELAAPRGESVP